MAHLPYGHINIYNITGTLHASHFVQLVVVKYQIFNVDGVELKKCSFDVMLVHQEQVIMQSQIVVARYSIHATGSNGDDPWDAVKMCHA